MHKFLSEKFTWYKSYHVSPHANVITWAVFIAMALFFVSSCMQSVNHLREEYSQMALVFEAKVPRDITINVSADPAQIKPGGTTRITWSSTGARRCVTSNGLIGVNGSFVTPVLNNNVVYTVTCSRPGSRVSSKLEIDIDSTLVANRLILNSPSTTTTRIVMTPSVFTVSANAIPTEAITIIPVSKGSGTFMPETITISSTTPSATFTYTPNVAGRHSIMMTNNFGLENSNRVSFEVQPSVLEARMDLFRKGLLRGMALSALSDTGVSSYKDQDFKDLAATGANVVRVPIHLDKNTGGDGYLIPEDDIQYVKRILDLGANYGFKVIVVLVPLPSGSGTDFWNSNSRKADIIKKWQFIANELKDYQAIVAYDLINEPVIAGAERVSALNQWHGFAVELARAVQAVDPQTPIMFEPVQWGLPGSFWQTPALGLSGIVYSFHMYDPHEFTHQGLEGRADSVLYPSRIWNSAYLYKIMLEARKIATAHNVPMFIGEFSCLRWAPQESCPKYLSDVTKLFADQKWGWTYHVWRSYQGWDAEIPTSVGAYEPTNLYPQYRTSTSTAFVLLKKAMSQNPLQ